MSNNRYDNRPVQILRVRPQLVLDLLRDLEQRALKRSVGRDLTINLEGAKVVGCVLVGNLIWLYLEKHGWPLVQTNDVPTLWREWIWDGNENQLTEEWQDLPVLQVSAPKAKRGPF